MQFNSWSIGNELEFKVKSFKNRRKGPIIQATFIRVLSEYKDDTLFNLSYSDMNATVTEPTMEETQETFSDLNITIPKKLKGKKNKKIIFNDDEELDEISMPPPSKKVKIKHENEEQDNQVSDQSEKKKKKKKKKEKQ